MRFVINGPDLPDRLVQAHEEGKVVLFCGAGISYPADLPGFKGLVDGLYQGLGETKKPTESAAYDAKRYDLVIDLLERRLKNRGLVREELRRVLTPIDPIKASDVAVSTHKALLTLANTRTGFQRLVTTNFDRLFFAADSKHASYIAPLLPVPKQSRWSGVVYLHGLLPEGNDPVALNQLVVSSGDFGLAYLTERWASRFVSELFRTYIVCFVGYSADDPVLRYMLDAISADRLLGESPNEVYAFGSFKDGGREEVEDEWQSKGVAPILYNATNSHENLHMTLQKWAELYQDGITGKRSIIEREAIAMPSPVSDDGHVDRVLWALSDPTGAPAKDFATRSPSPPVEWLAVLDSHGMLDKVCPIEYAPRITLVSHSSELLRGTNLDPPTFQLTVWVANHIDKREVLAWAINKGACLHPTLRTFVEKRLLKKDLSPPLATIWDIIASGRSAPVASNRSDIFGWLHRFKETGWSSSRKRELLEALSPVVLLRPPVDWSSIYKDAEQNEVAKSFSTQVRELVEWDIGLSGGDHLESYFEQVISKPEWKENLAELLPNLTDLLLATYELMSDLGSVSAQSDGTYSIRPSISDHSQNNDFRAWTFLVTLARDAFNAAAMGAPSAAKREFGRWTEIEYPLFKRLAMYGATFGNVVSPQDAIDFLLDKDAWWLWSVESQREMFRLLASLADKLDSTKAEKLCHVILAGPPRSMYRVDISEKEWLDVKDHGIWHRLQKLKENGATLPQQASDILDGLCKANPKWVLEEDQRDEFPYWMEGGWGRGSPLRQIKTLPSSTNELAAALMARPASDFWYEDNWSSIVKDEPEKAIEVLLALARDGKWPGSVWREALQGFADEKLVRLSWDRLFSTVLVAPDTFIEDMESNVSWWLKVVSSVVKEEESPQYLAIVDRVLRLPFDKERDKADSDEPVFKAINHSIGHVTQALTQFWFSRKPKMGQGLPDDLKSRFSQLMQKSPEAYRHGRVILAANLSALYAVDPDWTKENLIPCFDWASNPVEAKAMWEGYLWTPRIDDQLLIAIKPHFLNTADHFESLGKHKRQYADILVLARLEIPDAIAADETHLALEKIPNEGLADGTYMIVRALSGAGDERESYWTHRAKPLLKSVWPKSADKRSSNEARGLALVAIGAGDAFPEALETVMPLLSKARDTDHVVHRIKETQISKKFPKEVLRLLATIVEKGRGWRDDNLRAVLNDCVSIAPDLKGTPDYRYLDEHLQSKEA